MGNSRSKHVYSNGKRGRWGRSFTSSCRSEIKPCALSSWLQSFFNGQESFPFPYIWIVSSVNGWLYVDLSRLRSTLRVWKHYFWMCLSKALPKEITLEPVDGAKKTHVYQNEQKFSPFLNFVFSGKVWLKPTQIKRLRRIGVPVVFLWF